LARCGPLLGKAASVVVRVRSHFRLDTSFSKEDADFFKELEAIVDREDLPKAMEERAKEQAETRKQLAAHEAQKAELTAALEDAKSLNGRGLTNSLR
jgi:hypothetical protein